MKKIFSILSIFCAILILLFGYFFGKRGAVLDSNLEDKFACLSVQKGGRIMPLSSAAGDILRTLYGKSAIKLENGKYASASEWLLIVDSCSKEAETLKCFKTDNLELQNLMGASGRYYSFLESLNSYEKIYKISDEQADTLYGRACLEAMENLAYFRDAGNALGTSYDGKNFLVPYEDWNELVEKTAKEIERAKAENRPPDNNLLLEMSDNLRFFKGNFERWQERKSFNIYAIKNGESYTSVWGMYYEKSKRTSEGEAYLKDFANLLGNFKAKNFEGFKENLDSIYEKNPPNFRVKFENFCNRLDIFYRSAILYLCGFVAFLLSCTATKKYAEFFEHSGFIFLFVAVVAQLFGVCARVYIQMRPPITNLYSSIIFAGLASALIALTLLYFKREKIYAFACAASGGLSVAVAVNMAYSGDTMAMMRAVLNSNFWLTMHIVPMMLGYCGVFLAGFVASFRIIANLFSHENIEQKNREYARSVFNILCFAMAFSFLGTMLGGIWAQMSWGRFWGWDPKENGALMVVLWCAFVVHSYAMKLASDRFILAFGAFANVVAAWAWFGVNIMGIGLHSYGFMDGGAIYLTTFVAIQTLLAILAFLPVKESSKLLQ